MEINADFFISFSNRDKEWADWIAWTLDKEGYSVLYQPWDFAPGTNFVLRMNRAASSLKTIAVLSEHYLSSVFTQPEWAAAFAQDPTGVSRKLIPVRVSECDLSGTLLAQIVFIDLIGLFDQELARKKLIESLKNKKPSERPPFPSHSGSPPFPGTIIDPSTRSTSGPSGIPTLPPPGLRVQPSPPYVPPTFRGIQVHPDNPLILDFILDSGDAVLKLKDLGEVSLRLTKYFLSSLTIPDENLWVNLSPNESDKIIPHDLGQTQMGTDLLGQDYILKQLTSSLLYPEKDSGREYWDSVYSHFGREMDNSTVNTFNKIWITTDKAKVIERGTFAIIRDSNLKVLMEHDFATLQDAINKKKFGIDQLTMNEAKQTDKIASEIFKVTILPRITRDVNEGGNFAVLRQIYSSLILAVWYKEVLKRSIVEDLYINKSKTSGVGSSSNVSADAIYQQYLAAFRIGVFHYIREDVVGPTEEDLVPRKYYAGGFTAVQTKDATEKVVAPELRLKSNSSTGLGSLFWVRINLSEEDGDLIDEKFQSIDRTGGIDLSTQKGFDFEVEKEKKGIKFDISKDLIDRLHENGMGRLKPSVLFVKLIDAKSLEISKKTNLSEHLQEVDGSSFFGSKNNLVEKNTQSIANKLKQIWSIFRE